MMKMERIRRMVYFLTFLVLLLLSPLLTHAAEPYITRPLHLPLSISVPCSDDGGSCPADTECNLSLNYPNTSILISQDAMTRSGDFFNYSLANTSIQGEYQAYTVCCSVTSGTCDEEYFLIKIKGPLSINDCPESVAGMLSLFLLFGLLSFFIFFAFMIQNKALGFLCSIGLIMLSTVIVGCSSLFGYIVFGLGVILLLTFAFKK